MVKKPAVKKKAKRYMMREPDEKIIKKMFAELELGEKNMREILLSKTTPSRETFYAWVNNFPDIKARYDASLAIFEKIRSGFSSFDPDPEIIYEICNLLVEPGAALTHICRMEGMPSIDVFYRWIHQNPEYAERYWEARKTQAMAFSDMLWSVASDSSNDFKDGKLQKDHIMRDRLKVDTLKFICAKLLSHMFGDNKSVTVDVSHVHTLDDDQLNNQIKILQGRVGNMKVIEHNDAAVEN